MLCLIIAQSRASGIIGTRNEDSMEIDGRNTAPPDPRRRGGWLTLLGPGLLVAATGVGAGDLATASLTGSTLGVAVLWAVALGAFLKFVLNEGLARYQLATGQTLLEGAVLRLGWPVIVIFLPYLLLWSFFVGSALVSACGVATHALLPVFDDAVLGKRVFGTIASLVALVLVWIGGFRWFEKIMSVCIAVMFVTVLVTAVLLKPDWTSALRGLIWPTIPDLRGEGLRWTVALMGGVGGTLTVLAYGYWIREGGRVGGEHLRLCRIDLGVAYTATAIFGMAMVLIGGTIRTEGEGATLIVQLADRLREPLGQTGRWIFLIGAWGALFSSVLGVWQSVPYIFADFVSLVRHRTTSAARAPIDTRNLPYRTYLVLLAVVPLIALYGRHGFATLQKIYAIVGAFFMPLLALALLLLNGREQWVGTRYVNRAMTVVLLIAILLFFAWIGYTEARAGLGAG
jgi:Mn2+/Fe2+ NRAMP family transporter